MSRQVYQLPISYHDDKYQKEHRRNNTILLIKLFVLMVLIFASAPLLFYAFGPPEQQDPTAPAKPVETVKNQSTSSIEISRNGYDLKVTIPTAVSNDITSAENKLRQLRDTLTQESKTLDKIQSITSNLDGQKSNGKEGIVRRLYSKLSPTSIWCYGEKRYDRQCRFKNLYYHPEHDQFFAILTAESVVVNVPRDRSRGLVDLTSLDDHSSFFFNYEDVAEDLYQNKLVTVVKKRTFVLSRFHVGNIMHALHDDVLGLYHTIRHFSPADTSSGKPNYAAFSLDHYIQFVEGFRAETYGYLFETLTSNPLRFKTDLMLPDGEITCFEEAIVGQSKLANWYQYGFLEPQGPIKDKFVYGHHVRQVAEFILYQYGLSDDQLLKLGDESDEDKYLVLFSRRSNRLILNEQEVLDKLSAKFGLEGKFVRMEEMSFKEILVVLRRTKVAVGMHGSILIFGMFLKPGSVLIEGYPFAVPGDHYTPYKTMSSLPGMNIAYRAWENKHEDGNKMYPERSMYEGGINHLPEDQRKKIIETHTVPSHVCCADPYWLFRIYQDTVMNVGEVEVLIKDALDEVQKKNLKNLLIVPVIYPSRVDARSIKCTPEYAGDTVTRVKVEWEAPWNGVKPDNYLIWEHVAFKEWSSPSRSVELTHESYKKGVTLNIWVRSSINNGQLSPYSDKQECLL